MPTLTPHVGHTAPCPRHLVPLPIYTQILESAIKYRWKTLPAEQASLAAQSCP